MQLDDIDFVIIGAAKSATTWLQRQLQDDPAICMPDPELHYFSREYHRGTTWYLNQFPECGAGRVVGEKSNSYLDTTGTAVRLHAALPTTRLVTMVRDPVERAYSDYCMLFRRGEVDGNIENYLDPRRATGNRFLTGGLYDELLQPYLDLYGRDAILITEFSDVRERPQALINWVRRHLELEPRPLAESGRRKVKDRNADLVPLGLRHYLAWTKPAMKPLRGTMMFEYLRSSIARPIRYPLLTPDLRDRLAEYYRPSQERLAAVGLESPTPGTAAWRSESLPAQRKQRTSLE